MNKLKFLIVLIIGLSICSCSTDDNNSSEDNPDENNQTLQKLVNFSSTNVNSDDIQNVTKLIYDNDNLIKIEEAFVGIGENIWNYNYSDNNQLIAVNDIPISFIDGNLSIEYTYEREEYYTKNNKVIELTTYFKDEPDQAFQFNYKTLYTYLNENITEIKFFDPDDNITGFNTYQYDNMNNVLRGLKDINRWIFPISILHIASDNNIINRKEFDGEGNLLIEFQYGYEYDNNGFPTIRQTTILENGTSNTKTTFFNYE